MFLRCPQRILRLLECTSGLFKISLVRRRLVCLLFKIPYIRTGIFYSLLLILLSILADFPACLAATFFIRRRVRFIVFALLLIPIACGYQDSLGQEIGEKRDCQGLAHPWNLVYQYSESNPCGHSKSNWSCRYEGRSHSGSLA